ncbi:MAG: flagellar filament capping protein FliD, partial [Paucibacter sp.]|nr:flagellar filament capping protein FliD [Roseateles sp.]
DVSSSNSAVATASATSDATTGSYDLSVTSLAQGQVLTSSSVSDASSAIGTGTLSFQIGSGSAQTVQINASDDSLQGISDAINAAGIGISAAVTGNNGNYSLTLTGPTGAVNSYTVSSSGDGGLTAMFSYDPSRSSNPLTLSNSGAADAHGSLNNAAFSSATDTVTGAAGGLTLTLNGTGSSTLVVTPDATNLSNAVQTFVTDYNTVVGTLNNLSGSNAGNDVAGGNATVSSGGYGRASAMASALGLSTDPVLQTVQNTLNNIVSTLPAGSSFSGLSAIGLSTNSDGTLSFDSSVFASAVQANPSAVDAVFSNGSATGLGNQLTSTLAGITDGGGTLPSTISALQSQSMAEQSLQAQQSAASIFQPGVAGGLAATQGVFGGVGLYSFFQQMFAAAPTLDPVVALNDMSGEYNMLNELSPATS